MARFRERMSFIAAALALVSGLAASAAPATATASPLRATVEFEIGPGVSAEDERAVREGLRLGQDFVISTFGRDRSAPVVVALASAKSGAYGGNTIHGPRLQINTWTMRDAPPVDRLRLAAHEYFHLWQAGATGQTDRSAAWGPAWLVEGGANDVAFRALAAKGIVAWGDAREYLALTATGVHADGPVSLPPLRDLGDDESLTGPGVGCCSYALATLAVDALATASGSGIGSIGRYFERIGAGEDWWSAFRGAFGRTPDDYYRAFESARATALATDGHDVSGLLRRPRFNDMPAAISIVSAPETADRGGQVVIRGRAANGAHCRLRATYANGGELPTLPEYADAAGDVLWLWSVAGDAPTGDATLRAECGGVSVVRRLVIADRGPRTSDIGESGE